jgi:hypothetical protein
MMGPGVTHILKHVPFFLEIREGKDMQESPYWIRWASNQSYLTWKKNIYVANDLDTYILIGQSIVNRSLMRNVQNWLIEGSRLNCSGCRTQVKQMKIT